MKRWSAAHCIFLHSPKRFPHDADWLVITGTINLVFALIALSLVDKFGRRALMLFGCAGIALSHMVLGLAYRAGVKGLPVLVLTLCTIGCYALFLAPVTSIH